MPSWKLAGLLALLVFAFWTVIPSSPSALSQTQASNPVSGGTDADVQVVSTLLPTGTQQIVVVDTSQRAMAVYHVDPADGKIQLKSVRQLDWDLKMEHFNGQAPLPSELREVSP
ncbi:MAG: hypothetical protein AAF483_09375 [Planctomycetota bacterium]